jgi:putative oxidoreductase
MRTGLSDWVALLGRLLMGAIFIIGGYNKAAAPTATMAYLTKLGVPMPGAAYAVTLAVEIGVAALFLIGFRARLTALALAAWCFATAMVSHYHPADQGQMIHFLKNLCMAGGFLQIAAYGAGRLSLSRT